MLELYKYDDCPLGRRLSPSSPLCNRCPFHKDEQYVSDPWSSYYLTQCSADESGVAVVTEEEPCPST